MQNILLTVFTPTYNRVKLLERLYNSLKIQSSFNFKWLVVDDGSTDGTEEYIKNLKRSEKKFKIEYIYKENGGLHTGYNTAIENTDTELIMCIDSDDWLPNNSIKTIERIWNNIDHNKYIGILGLDCYSNGNYIIDKFPEKIHELYQYELLTKYNIKGDKKEIFQTNILKKVYPQPTYNNEKNFNPQYMLYKADNYGKMYCINECLCYVEYQNEGMTNSIYKQYYNSPRSFAEIRKLYMTFPKASLNFLFKHNIHYVSSCFLAKRLNYAIKESPKKILTLLAFPFGILLGIYIKYKNEKN